MKIAYIITAYKLPDLLVRLVQRLNTEETSFFIHVDKKTDEEIISPSVMGITDVVLLRLVNELSILQNEREKRKSFHWEPTV